MAIRFTNSTSSGITVTVSGDTWITRQDRYVASTGDAFDFGATDNVEYFLQGDIFAGDEGIAGTGGANNLSIVVGLGASINAGGDGIQLLGSPTEDSGHRVTNDGSIIGESGEGVDIRARFSQITNNGFISGSGFGVFINGVNSSIFNHGRIAGDSSGAGVSGDFAELFNHGSITGGGDGLDVSGNQVQVTNTGTISAGGTGIALAGTGTIVNSGVVIGDTQGVSMNSSLREPGVLFNSGTITVMSQLSTAFAFSGSGNNERVVNSGLMQGDIALRGGLDDYDGRGGRVVGTIDGGEGDDNFLGGDHRDDFVGGVGNDTIFGGEGGDSIRGDDGADSLGGGAGADTIDGGVGRDTIWGGSGEDVISGANGNDSILGGSGNDQISGDLNSDTIWAGSGDDTVTGGIGPDQIGGGAGDDSLSGGTSADSLYGGSGRDTLVGGADNDTIWGGLDEDVFVYNPGDSGPALATTDVIMDFEVGVDVIDLRAVSAGTLTFIGTAGFSSSAPEVRFTTPGGKDTRLLVDADGNGSIDMRIDLIGTTGLSAGDLLL